VASSVAGVSHSRTDQGCQDSHRWAELGDGTIVAAIADGAGSAAMGGRGAEIAARSAVEVLSRRTEELLGSDRDACRPLLAAALQEAQAAVLAAAAEQGAAPRDLATTLIVLALTPRMVAAAQVGDGAVVFADEAGRLAALTSPTIGADAEYINETTFLTSPDCFETAQFAFSPNGVSRVAAFTDGLQRLALKMPSGEPHAPFFAPLFRFAAEEMEPAVAATQLESFLRSPRITERADDDLTLLLAARLPGAAAGGR
jgi:hypothetical protein